MGEIMEYIVLILGILFCVLLAYILLGNHEIYIPQSELDDMAVEQMKESGLSDDEIDNILWRNK